MDPLLPRLETEERRRRGRLLFHRGKIPLRMVVPNFFTVLSLCAGLTALRMAIEPRLDMAIAHWAVERDKMRQQLLFDACPPTIH